MEWISADKKINKALPENLWVNITIISYKGSILQNHYADHLSVYYSSRQDLQDFQDFFTFPACPVKSGEERQKPISLFGGVHLAIKTEQRNNMNIRQQYYLPLWFSSPRL